MTLARIFSICDLGVTCGLLFRSLMMNYCGSVPSPQCICLILNDLQKKSIGLAPDNLFFQNPIMRPLTAGNGELDGGIPKRSLHAGTATLMCRTLDTEP